MRANEFIIEISKKYDNMIPPPHWDPRWPVEYRKIYDRYKKGTHIMGNSDMQIIGMMNNYVPRKNNMNPISTNKHYANYRQRDLIPAGIVDLYSKGKTPTDIANFYRIPLEQVINTLKAQDIKQFYRDKG